jgi:hypothetical protein
MLKNKDAEQWMKAVNTEIDALQRNETWDLVELPKDRKAISCKWIFKVKLDQSGKVDCYKARLVARGYSQEYLLDYNETFAPVVRFNSIRTLIAWAANASMKIHQMDVKTAFLNGELKEEIYMQQPDGFVEREKENLVCRLKKSIYGLKQAPRCWSEKFNEFLESLGFESSDADPCVFVGKNAVLAIYVDDLIVVTKTDQEMEGLKKELSAGFEMRDLGELHYILGVDVERTSDGIALSQQHYIEKLLKKFRMETATSVSTPMDVNVKLQKEDGYSKPVDKSLYQSMVGSLLYIAMITRPDIAYAVGVLGRFASCPTEAHLTAARRIFRYLKMKMSLVYPAQPSCVEIVGYSDADWANSLDDRRSTSGNVFMMNRTAVSWQSKKQPLVALSSAEAEYIAITLAAQEAVWMKSLLHGIGLSMDAITIC